MAFGLSPKYIENIELKGLSHKQVLVIANETSKRMDWDIGNITISGFMAYSKISWLSWSEEIQINIDNETLKIKSECLGSQIVDWGKNKKNVELFVSAFKKNIDKYSDEEINTKYVELEKEFIKEEDSILNQPPLSQKGKLKGVFSILVPTEGYFITPILIILNIVLFGIMVISGVNVLMPDNDSLLLWGANFKPFTLDDQWWRLVTSCFLHIGIFHLLMNMYALFFIGILLEPYLGKSRFIFAYFLTGITGSVASLYWNDLTISAGASGAIFGMYGVFLAMLSTNLIEKSARKSLLVSISIFVGYNLLNGFNQGIDNAAHIGGLVGGLIIGYSFLLSLKEESNRNLKYVTILALTVLILFGSYAVVSTSSNDMVKYEEEMQKFVLMEETALNIFSLPDNTTDEEYIKALKENGFRLWEKSLNLIQQVDQLDLPDAVHLRNSKLIEYCKLRKESYELVYQMIIEQTDIYDAQIETLNVKIEAIIKELTNQ